MEIRLIDREDSITQVQLIGSLDFLGMQQVDVQFHGVTSARRQPCIVDLSGVNFVASLGVGMFFACAKTLRNHGAKMAVFGANDMVQSVLQRTQLQSVVPIVSTVDEAIIAVSE